MSVLSTVAEMESAVRAASGEDRWTAMLILADALEDAGDPTAAGWRWLAEKKFWPALRGNRWVWELWWLRHDGWFLRLPVPVFRRLIGAEWVGTESNETVARDYPTRFAAEQDLARAVTEAIAAGEIV